MLLCVPGWNELKRSGELVQDRASSPGLRAERGFRRTRPAGCGGSAARSRCRSLASGAGGQGGRGSAPHLALLSLTQLCSRQAGRAFSEWLRRVCLDPEKAGCKQRRVLGFSYLKVHTMLIYINVY